MKNFWFLSLCILFIVSISIDSIFLRIALATNAIVVLIEIAEQIKEYKKLPTPTPMNRIKINKTDNVYPIKIKFDFLPFS